MRKSINSLTSILCLAQNGVNNSALSNGLSYLKSALSRDIPVVVHIPYNNSPETPFIWADYFHNLSLNGLQNCSFFQNEIGTLNPTIAINL